MPLYAVLAAALLLPAAAGAQSSARSGDEVIVTQSSSGVELRGHLVELSSTTLAILVAGKRVEVPLENVLRIEGRHDPVKNGAIIGAAVMGGLSLLGCATYGGDAGWCLYSTSLNAAFGGLMGAGIDALHKGRTSIYSKPAVVGLAVAPSAKAARVQFRFGF